MFGVLPNGVWGSPAYFNGWIYYGSQNTSLLQFQFTNAATLDPVPFSASSVVFAYPGTTPSVSSSGNQNGIVWAYEFGQNSQAVLHAYDATNVGNELYNSNQVQIGAAVKFAVPTVCNGKVFVGTANSVAVFGLLSPPPPGPQYVQGNYAVPQTPQITVTVPYTGAQTGGNLNVVIVGWNDTIAQVSSVTDAKGNVYQLAVGPTLLSGALSQSIYYAKNIVNATPGANAVTVTFDTAAIYPDIRILEYSGIDTVNPLDVVVGVQGNSATSSSGAVATTNANDLLVGANIVTGGTTGAGSGFTQRLLTNPDGDIAEDGVVTATGSYSASAPLSNADGWVMQIVAFRALSGGGG